GEVLDFNLYSTDPGGTLGQEPTASSTSMFIKLDGVGTSEDMIIILKLYDTVTGIYTTKAVVVQNADIIKSDAALTGTAYDSITLDNNDGLIVIEPNDYQEGNTNLVIVGAQIAGSDEGITGSGINLNGAIGVGSTGTQPFDTDVSDAPFKITSIGFVTTSTADQNASLSFDVTVEDADGDAVTQSIIVNIGDTTTTTSTASTAVVSQEPIEDTSAFSLTSSDSLDQQRSMSAANNNSVLLGAIAAAGLGVGSAAAANGFAPGGDYATFGTTAFGYDGGAMQGYTLDSRDIVSDAFGGESLEIAAGDYSGGPSASHSAIVEKLSLTDAGGEQSLAPIELPQGTEIQQPDPAQSAFTSAVVGMPSAEMLASANGNALDAQAQGTAEVGRVLIDALAGGGGPDIDAVLDAAANQVPGGNAALDALASHGAAAVSGWDTAGFAGFPGGHSSVTVDPMLHHDAVVAAA
ncbi:MAG TPA: hypothetical protein VFU20_06240, partial [Sphingomicrobium sp.]|nr:hypothetical protein [Sphingomicrobium sp.]